jgi:YfiH family protein
MKKENNGDLTSFLFENLEQYSVFSRVISRKGGFSAIPFDSLNLGGTVGDDPKHLASNKDIVWRTYGIDPGKVFDAWQVHGTSVIYTKEGRTIDQPHQKADILVTDVVGLTLLMRFADCVSTVIYDPKHHAIGIAHAGWQGTVQDVAGTLVKAMSSTFDSEPAALIAGIGPAICIDHYQVGKEVFDQFRDLSVVDSTNSRELTENEFYLDLKKINSAQLKQAGVQNIENSNICTSCDVEHWFSHRRDKGRTGRFGAFIQLRVR